MKLYLFIIGFISLLGQVAILRELNVAFYGIELIYILAIGFWLVGTAAGAYTGRKKFIPSEKHIDFLFIIFGLVLIIDVLFIRSISFLMGGTTGTYLSFGKQLSGMFISIMPVSFLLGLMFQWSAKKFVVNGKNLAFAYAVESAGGFAGGFASTYLMKFGFSNLLLILICSAVSVLIILFYRRKQLSKIKLYGIIIYTVIMLLLMLNSKNIDHRMTKWQYPGLLAVKDTPYSRVAITSAKGQITVFENGALAYESESVSAETFVHLPMLQRDSMRHVLVLGGGVEGVIKEIAKYDLSSVDYVELNKDLLQLLKSNFPNKDVFNFNYDKLKIIYTDPREFLKKSEALQKYDLILVGMPQPMSAGSSRFYTMEFFRQCKNRLTANGIMAFRLQTAENIWSPQQELKISGIYNALNAVFEKIVVLPGTTNLLIASSKYLDKNGESIVERFKSQNISARLISSPYINYLYTNDRFFHINKLLKEKDTRINSDSQPVCYQFAIMVWLSKFFPDLAFRDISSGIKSRFYSIIFLLIISLLVLSRFRRNWKNNILAAVAGFAGMIMETLLILNYQVYSGVLFQDIGLLLMAFMAGLTAGAYLMNKLAVSLNSNSFKYYWCGVGTLLLFAAQSLIFFIFIGKDFVGSFIGSWIMIFLSGFLTAGIFAYASFRRVEDQKMVVSPLYAADLIGGAIGALIATLWLIPVLGMKLTAIGIGGLALLAVLLL